MRQRELTRRDVVFVLECKAQGIKIGHIARYVYGVSSSTLTSRLHTWGAI